MAISDKLTYLNTTKTKIREGLNSLGADLDTEDTFRSYADAIEGIYEDYPKITGEGESLSLDNTKQASMQIDYKGQTSQVSYSGINLIEPKLPSQTINGITLTNNGDGSYKINGTATANVSFRIDQSTATGSDNLKDYNGTYTLSCPELTSGMQLVLMQYGTYSMFMRMNGNNTPVTATIDKEDCFIYVYVANGTTINNLTIKPMLEKSSSASAWQPYVGGTASPNPSFPQPINVVSGDNYIDICGKNLFDKSVNYSYTNAANTWTITQLDTGFRLKTTYITSGNPFVTYIIKDVTNYVGKIARFKCNFAISGNRYGKFAIGLCASDGSNRIVKSETSTSGNTISFEIPTLSGTQTYLYCAIYSITTTGSTANDYVDYTDMIATIDNEDTTYEPYIGNSYPIYLGVENLFKGYENMSSGFIPSSGNYPTTNSSYPNARYQLIELRNGESLVTSNSTNAQGRFRYIDKTTNQVVGAITNTTNEYFTSTGNYSAGFASGTITAKKDFIVAIMLLQNITQDKDFIITKGNNHVSTNPIELCKIGTYQDYIYKDNGSWYLHKEIRKVVLNGSESNWASNTGDNASVKILPFNDYKRTEENICFSDYFKSKVNSGYGQVGLYQVCFRYNANDTNNYLYIGVPTDMTIAQFTTWLSTHNTIVYYVLATPTNTLIEDTTLIEQLEESKLSYASQTNISQENNDLPFILDVKALRGE